MSSWSSRVNGALQRFCIHILGTIHRPITSKLVTEMAECGVTQVARNTYVTRVNLNLVNLYTSHQMTKGSCWSPDNLTMDELVKVCQKLNMNWMSTNQALANTYRSGTEDQRWYGCFGAYGLQVFTDLQASRLFYFAN